MPRIARPRHAIGTSSAHSPNTPSIRRARVAQHLAKIAEPHVTLRDHLLLTVASPCRKACRRCRRASPSGSATYIHVRTRAYALFEPRIQLPASSIDFSLLTCYALPRSQHMLFSASDHELWFKWQNAIMLFSYRTLGSSYMNCHMDSYGY